MNVKDLCKEISSGNHRALAKAVTLIESQRPSDRSKGLQIIDYLRQKQPNRHATKIALSGPPGAGKSTLINELGACYLAAGHRVAVLAVDPTSPISGGSILGDRTRMSKLNSSENCFVRPTPTRGEMGGLAPHTYDTSLLCEAAGFDIIIIETVGVGQSETRARQLVDCYIVLQIPGSGDDVQGIKRGILELSDVVVINKTDGDLKVQAKGLQQTLKNALHLARGENAPKIVMTSAIDSIGIEDLQSAITEFTAKQMDSGRHADRLAAQREYWFDQAIWYSVKNHFESDNEWGKALKQTRKKASEGNSTPSKLAHDLVVQWLTKS